MFRDIFHDKKAQSRRIIFWEESVKVRMIIILFLFWMLVDSTLAFEVPFYLLLYSCIQSRLRKRYALGLFCVSLHAVTSGIGRDQPSYVGKMCKNDRKPN